MEVLIRYIKKRGRNFEQQISPAYLTAIQDAYIDYLKTETETPVVILELGEIDFQHDPVAFRSISQVLARQHAPGIQFLKL